MELCGEHGVLWSVEEDTCIFLCCAYQSVPNHFRLSLPCLQKKEHWCFFSQKWSIHRPHRIASKRRKNLSLPPCSPLGGLDAVERRRGRERSTLQRGRAGFAGRLDTGYRAWMPRACPWEVMREWLLCVRGLQSMWGDGRNAVRKLICGAMFTMPRVANSKGSKSRSAFSLFSFNGLAEKSRL